MALIAEIKKASPSEGNINLDVDVQSQARAYSDGGASAISVLTDSHFKGELHDLERVKQVTAIPILRKDFIFDPYQIYESKYYGADAILLIASILSLEKLNELLALANDLGLGCLVEARTSEDLKKILATPAPVIGINARDLTTFQVNLDHVTALAHFVPTDRYLIAESGIETEADVQRLVGARVKGVLVGTALMKAKDVGAKIKELQLIL